MNITKEEREILRGMRGLTINPQGYEVFVGLSPEESEEFLFLSRRNESGEDMTVSPKFKALREKHEAARQEIVNGRARLDD